MSLSQFYRLWLRLAFDEKRSKMTITETKRFIRKDHGFCSYEQGYMKFEILHSLYSPRFIMKKQQLLLLRKINENKITFNKVINFYDLLRTSNVSVDRLRKANPDQFIVTRHEREVLKLLNRKAKHKFKSAFTIGSPTYDLFCDAYKYDPLKSDKLLYGVGENNFLKTVGVKDLNFTKYQGLIIEVDGPVHNLEEKMKMDTRKFELAARLGVLLYRINNDEIYKREFKFFVHHLAKMKYGCSRARKLLNFKIQLSNVAFLATDADLIRLTGLNTDTLILIHSFFRKIVVPETSPTPRIEDKV